VTIRTRCFERVKEYLPVREAKYRGSKEQEGPMSEYNKIGTNKLVAEPFHVDFPARTTMGVLGNHPLKCAGFHDTERGVGIDA
jgi:hypothetical protein